MLSASAWGQAASADPQAAPPPALSGPRVEQPISNTTQTFVPTEREREARSRLSSRMLPTILREMASRRAPDKVRLSAEQLRQIEDIRRAHDAEVNEFVQGRKGEIVSNLRELGLAEFAERIEGLDRVGADQIRAMVERGPRAALTQLVGPEKLALVDSGQLDRKSLLSSLTPAQRTALESLTSLRQGIPGDEGFHVNLLALLDEGQRGFVEERLTQMLRRMPRDGQMTERAVPGEAAGSDPAGADSAGAMADGMIKDPGREMADASGEQAEPLPRLLGRQRADRLDRLLERLTPEQREMFADLIERRMLGGGRIGDATGREKAPPSMDGIELPPP